MKKLNRKVLAVLVACMIVLGYGNVQTANAESSTYAVTFNANGGSTAASASLSADASNNDTVTLPDYTGTKAGYTFAGWSTSSNLTSSTYYAVYEPGTTLTVSKDTALYAVWTTSVTGNFFIRLDGTTPYEPSQYANSSYTKGITIANAVKANTWVCDTTGVKVLADLNAVPTDAQIKAVYPSYDPATQYIKWYVIKYSGSWHIDGVLQDKAKIDLTYDGNGTGDVSNVPLGSQYYEGDSVTVGATGGNNGAVTEPERAGYTFIGWNTEADGSGTSYAGSDTFTITENTTLYAQWKPNAETAYTVEWIDAANNNVLKSVTRYGATGNTASVDAADKSYDGYNYAGDTYTGTVLSGTIAGDGSTTLKIYFNEKQYNVTYQDVNGNTLQTTAEYSGTAIDTYKGTTPVKDADSTYTYTFTGWTLAEGTEGANATVGKTDLVYTPVFSDNYIDYTVTYDLNGGTEADAAQLSYTALHQGDATPVIADPVKESDGTYVYVFNGWSPAVAETVTGNATYVAQWNAVTIMHVTAENVEGVYNGTAYTLDAAVADTDNALIEYSTDNGETWSTTVPSRTDAGVTTVLVRASKDGYTTATTSATITVTKRSVVLTSASDSKSYDGTALTNGTVTASEDGFVSGEGAIYTVTGTQTAVGISANTFTYVLQDGTNADNYDITTKEGVLTVTEARVVTPITTDNTDDSSTTTTVTEETTTASVGTATADRSLITTPVTSDVESTPNTGDTYNWMLYAFLGGLSLAALLMILYVKHSYSEQK